MSLAVPLLPPPVLSPTRQSDGRPARRRLPPVLLASSQPMSCSARSGRQGVADQKALHVAQHGGGRGGVARIAGRRLVELGLDAVEPRRPVTQGARIGGQGRWAAEACEQQVARRVVAQRHRRLADFRHRHAAGPDMILGDRRIGDEVLGRRRRCGDPAVSSPRSTRASTSAAARNLKVLDIGKRSSLRQPARRPLAVSSAATPRRPPTRRSRSASAEPASSARAGSASSEPANTARRAIEAGMGFLRPGAVAAYAANMARRGHNAIARSN